jgi:hypothetical protein
MCKKEKNQCLACLCGKKVELGQTQVLTGEQIKSPAQPGNRHIPFIYIYIYIHRDRQEYSPPLCLCLWIRPVDYKQQHQLHDQESTSYHLCGSGSCELQVAGCKGREYPLSSLGVGPGALGASAFGFAVKYRHGYYYRPDLQNATRNAPRRNFLSLTLTRIRLANRLEKGVSSPVKQQTEILRQISIILGFFFGLRRPKRQDA